MILANERKIGQTSRKKRVTFSFCTDKDEPLFEVPTQNDGAEIKNKCSELRNRRTTTHNKACAFIEPIYSTGKICDVKKTLVRNVEQSLSHTAHTRVKQCPSKSVDVTFETGIDVKSIYKNKYAAPELYTTLCIAKEIQATERLQGKRPSGLSNPSAKEMLDVKILNKLNFPFEEKLYKGLVSLTVCEKDLLGSSDHHREVEFRQVKDQEPQIVDFCVPYQGKEYKIVEEPEPCSMERIKRYDGFSLYKRSQTWISD